MRNCRAYTVLLAVLFGAASAFAQEPAKDAKPPVPPVSSMPERTTASFGDWILRCEGAAGKQACEVALVLTAQGQTAPVAQVAIGREPVERRPLTIVLPHNVSLLVRPQIVMAKNAKPLDLTWQRCNPGACFASIALTADILSSLKAQTESGKIVYKTAADQDIALPLSVRGLPQALDAMEKVP